MTIPDPEPTVATDALPLLHVPGVVTSLSVVVCPAHTAAVPVTAAGKAWTVTSVVKVQPAPKE